MIRTRIGGRGGERWRGEREFSEGHRREMARRKGGSRGDGGNPRKRAGMESGASGRHWREVEGSVFGLSVIHGGYLEPFIWFQ